MYIYTCVCVCVCVCVYIYNIYDINLCLELQGKIIHTCIIYICIYVYIYTHTHTIHAHTQIVATFSIFVSTDTNSRKSVPQYIAANVLLTCC